MPELTAAPVRVLSCSFPGCSSAWFTTTVWDSVAAKYVVANHDRAVRRARVAGWTGDDSTGCLCANRDIRCPDHAA